MNRLIIVGNGFDLAHQLKTSYCDFIADYICNAINHFFTFNHSNDPLVELKYKFAGHTFKNPTYVTPDTALETLRFLNENNYATVNIKSSFLSETLKRVVEINWVDLENDYFDQLLALKNAEGFNFEEVKKLNIEFDFLKTKLEEYLLRNQVESDSGYSEEYVRYFCEPVKNEEILTRILGSGPPQNILLLSFNYTNTLENYQKICSKQIPTSINYIHGKVAELSNPIIFGFGDEFNKSYLEFEDIKNKELLKHIKSFGYFKASNYHNLIKFIELQNFQVYIFGHSLGLSDRTMLKEIFEHKNCLSIKIFYHKKENGLNDYTDKTFDISSHFRDKGVMRKRIVPFNLSFPMPQVKLPK